jgi:hypothetical protein
MNFGYLLIVNQQDENCPNYAKMAYALALSIKNTQKPGYDQVAVVINDKKYLKEFKSLWVFDQVIEWSDKTFWDGRSYMDKLTPFENTICLDVDMLFLRDYSHYIEYFLENCDLYVTNRSYTYRGEIVSGNYYRKAFTKNNLPNLYSFYTFFKKNSETTKEFFSLVRNITEYPREFSNIFLGDYKPKILGTDEIFSLSSKILGIQDDISYDLEFPKIVHLKPMIQNWPWPAESVTHHVGLYLNKKGQLKIGNYNQTGIVHYVDKEFITDENLNILEELAWKK